MRHSDHLTGRHSSRNASGNATIFNAYCATTLQFLFLTPLIIAEEFSRWTESSRRIDLLGIDRDANLVVIELKRTSDGGQRELQALRYAAMISTLTFDEAVETFEKYLIQYGREEVARQVLLDHLGWDTSEDPSFRGRFITP